MRRVLARHTLPRLAAVNADVQVAATAAATRAQTMRARAKLVWEAADRLATQTAGVTDGLAKVRVPLDPVSCMDHVDVRASRPPGSWAHATTQAVNDTLEQFRLTQTSVVAKQAEADKIAGAYAATTDVGCAIHAACTP